MIFKKYFKLHYWPPLTCIWFLVTFIITFSLSVLQEHVYIYFPFISDTGANPPESCIFGQLLNIGAVIFMITAYIRYRQVGFIIKLHEATTTKKWNTLSCWCALLVSIGISMVGNFQETLLFYVHCFAAFMAFGVGSFYLLSQTVISFSLRHIYHKNPEYGIGPKMLYFRILLTIVCIILFNITSIGLLLAFQQFTGDNIAWWTEEHGGFEVRIVATFSEWILAILFVVYMLTLTNEYKLMEYEEVRFKNTLQNCGEKEQDNTKI